MVAFVRSAAAAISSVTAVVSILLSSPLASEQRGSPAVALSDLLLRTAEYVNKYEAQFAAVVSEEHYRQSEERMRAPALRRDLKSDVLVINAGQGGWIGFRDVFEVDGRAVRDHDQRLSRLFVDQSADTMTHARQIADESARYNLGGVKRNINVPTMALSYLRADYQSRSTFAMDGAAKIDSVATVVVSFAERHRPTVIRSGDTDAPATGRFWIDPDTGRVVRSQIKLAPPHVSATIMVTYSPAPKLNLWVPVSMDETYLASSGEWITGDATYSNFRRFSVDVTTIIKTP